MTTFETFDLEPVAEPVLQGWSISYGPVRVYVDESIWRAWRMKNPMSFAPMPKLKGARGRKRALMWSMTKRRKG